MARQRGSEGSGIHLLIGITNHQTCLVLPSRLRALKDAGFRLSLVCGPGELLERTAESEGVATYPVEMRRGVSPCGDLMAFVRLWRLLRRLKPDAVEFSTPKAGLLGCVAAWVCRVPVRIYFLRGLKLETSSGLKRWILLWAERIASACAQTVLCNSRSLLERAFTLRIGPSSKLVLLGEGSSNGVDVSRFSPGPSNVREKLNISFDAFVLGFVGRLTADKGLPELLEAFTGILREQPDAYLLLVGWFDACEDALERRTRERVEGHPRIIHTSMVSDTAPYFRAMDLMVLPSWREGFPNAILEAAASGIPAVATLCTGSRDAVVPEVTGLLVPKGNPEALRDACLRLMSNPEELHRMGHAARTWAVEHFDSRRVLRLTTDFYSQLSKRAAR